MIFAQFDPSEIKGGSLKFWTKFKHFFPNSFLVYGHLIYKLFTGIEFFSDKKLKYSR